MQGRPATVPLVRRCVRVFIYPVLSRNSSLSTYERSAFQSRNRASQPSGDGEALGLERALPELFIPGAGKVCSERVRALGEVDEGLTRG
jgi:hypothetical protein